MSRFYRDELDLSQLNIAIAGNTASLGDTLANTFANAGAKVVAFTTSIERINKSITQDAHDFCYINSEGEITNVFELGDKFTRAECPSSELDDVMGAWEKLTKKIGQIDIFIHTGGRISKDAGLRHDKEREQWVKIIEESTKRYENMMRAAAKFMLVKEGSTCPLIVSLHHHAKKELFDYGYWNPYEAAVKQKRKAYEALIDADILDGILTTEIITDLLDRSQLPRVTTAYVRPKKKVEVEVKDPWDFVPTRKKSRAAIYAKLKEKTPAPAPEKSILEVPVFNYASCLDEAEIVNAILFLLVLQGRHEVPSMTINNTWTQSKHRRRARDDPFTRYA